MYEDFIFIFVGSLLVFFGITKITFNSRKVQRTVRLIGEGPTRILYIILGFVFVYLGLFVY